MKEEINSLTTQAVALRKKYEATPKDLTPDEQGTWDRILNDIDIKQAELERLMRTKDMEDAYSKATNDEGLMQSFHNGEISKRDVIEVKAFTEFIRLGANKLNPEYRAALQADDNVGGGYLIVPQVLWNRVLTNAKDRFWMRSLCTNISVVGAQTLGIPTIDTDMNDADWTGEITAVSEDTALAFGKRELKPYPLSKLVKVSMKLINNSPNALNIVLDRLMYRFALTEEKAFLTGTGVNQPLGIMTASTDGVTTARDTTTATNDAIGADDFIDVKHSLKQAYWRNAVWVFNRDVLKKLRKLKDSSNNYLWQPGLYAANGLSSGNPATVQESPYYVSEYTADVADGAYVACLFDPEFYWIANGANMSVQVLTELYAGNNQFGYIGRMECDGAPVLAEAFARLKVQ